MASVLGGVQSMFTAAWDEPFALPSEESTTLALRTQQILAYETGIARVVDPLGGSYYVEALTDAMEKRLIEIMADLEARGGMVQTIEDGTVQRLIAGEAYRVQKLIESGERVVVGVNRFQTNESVPAVQAYEISTENRARQLDRLASVKRSRNSAEVRDRLSRLAAAARVDDVNLMPHLIECAKAYCSVGEMVSVLKDVWGEYKQPAGF
jgi:methylmalonyl-CoA mutase N-terminal domain/subunit